MVEHEAYLSIFPVCVAKSLKPSPMTLLWLQTGLRIDSAEADRVKIHRDFYRREFRHDRFNFSPQLT